MVPRYYSGVHLRRTTISCVGALILGACVCLLRASEPLTFPLQVQWSAALPAPPAFEPTFDDQHAYFPLRNNELVALLIKDGSVAWSVECPMTAAPAAGDDRVFAGSEGLVEARAKADGRAQWRRPIKGRVISLHWDTGWLIAATEAGPLVAIRAADGEILWQRDFGSPLSAPPAPAGDRLYLALKDGRITVVTLQSGEDIWTRQLTEPAAGMLPVGDRVFVGGRDNQFHSLDAKDGDSKWHWKTGADVLGLPVLDERRVYFIALDNVLRGHHRNNGSMLWKVVLPMRPFTGPILSGGTLIVAGVASELHAYNAYDGKLMGPPFVVKGVENEEMLLAAPPYLTSQRSLILVTKGGQVRALGNAPAAPSPAPASAPATPAPAGSVPPDAAAAPAVP